MPLAQPLAELRQNLEAQIREGQLPDALNALLAQVPDGSETQRIVSALIARLNAANKERYRNTISSEEYQRRVDQVSADFFDLLAGLKEADFEVPDMAGKPASAKAMAGKQGSVLYRVPHVMPIQKPTRCTIRVAVDEDAILENILLDEHVQVKSRVEISDVMSAELVDPEGGTFQINALNKHTQLVRDTGFTEWNFSVTPLREGVHQLLVKVSIMEIVPGYAEPIPREVSVMETVTIVTESAAPSDAPPSDFKPSGQSFAFQSSFTAQSNYEVSYSPAPATSRESWTSNRGLRAMALFLAFIILAPAATWAFTPPVTRDWWVASLKDSPEAYTEYISEYREIGSPHLEKAFFYKADASGQLADLRVYQQHFPQGKFETKVIDKIALLEIKAVASIRQQPEPMKIRQFVTDFPESERLPEVKQAVDARADLRMGLLPVVEEAYVASVQAQPTETKVAAYLRDFPQQERLNEVAAAAAAEPVVFRKAQPELEDAYLKKMEQNPTEAQSAQFLQKFPEPVRKEKFEKILDKNPALKKAALAKMQKAEEARMAREAETARLQELQRRAQAAQNAQERQRLEKEAALAAEALRASEAKEAERLRAEQERTRQREEAEATERKRLEAEAAERQRQEAQRGDDSPPIGGAGGGRPRRSGLEMVSVAGGTYTMGDDTDSDQDNCAHQVTVSTFSIGKYEVTQGDWFEIMGTKPSYFKDCDECPVEQVSWDDIQDFLKKLNAKYPGKNYRLPTEAEWEYAARGGNKSKGYKYAGSNDIGKVAWYSSNSGSKTHRVGELAANELGIFDMSGNVQEWCKDKYGPYPGCASPKEVSSSRVLRGGAWNSNLGDCFVSRRINSNEWGRYISIGSRLAQDK